MTSIPSLRRHVVVAASPDRAYRAWRDEIGAWWPLARFAVFDGDTRVAFEGDQIVETSPDGERSVWGTVLDDEPGRRLRFSWHPGADGERGEVEVEFVPIDATRTLVTLEHSGWEAYEAPADARAEYRGGWPTVLALFGAAAVPPGESGPSATASADEVWLILEHTPGLASIGGPVTAHPLFAEHGAFLARLAEARVLIAAGPLPAHPGHGQTIVRVPAGAAADWVAAAEADGAVAGDLLVLRVRPWSVVTSRP